MCSNKHTNKIKTRPHQDSGLSFSAIYTGCYYIIDYVDPNYPCNCRCHTDPHILHVIECCYDRSYRGPALCVGKNYDTLQAVFLVSNHHFYIIHYTDVRDVYIPVCDPGMTNAGPQFSLTPSLDVVNYAREKLGLKPYEEEIIWG